MRAAWRIGILLASACGSGTSDPTNFVGSWKISSGNEIDTCNGGAPSTMDLSSDAIEVAKNGDYVAITLSWSWWSHFNFQATVDDADANVIPGLDEIAIGCTGGSLWLSVNLMTFSTSDGQTAQLAVSAVSSVSCGGHVLPCDISVNAAASK
jgi:hypothetical protein